MKKEAQKESKYHAILDAAEAVMHEEGLASLSINKVARKAGVAKGTVYLYFEDKEEIIGSLAVKARRLLLDYFKKYIEAQTDPIEKIKAIFWADYHYLKEQHGYHQLITFYEQNTGLKETGELANTGQAISMYIKDVIEDAINQKAIRQDIDSGALSFMFWGMSVGIIQLVETRHEQLKQFLGKSPEEFYTLFINTTVDAMKVRK